MLQKILSFCLFVLLISCGKSTEKSEPLATTFQFITGTVQVIPEKEAAFAPKINTAFLPGQQVQTGMPGMAMLKVQDYALTRVLSSSQVTFEQLVKSFEAKLQVGDVYFKVNRLDKDFTFVVKSEGYMVGVRGTTFHVSRKEGKFRVSVDEGSVEVTSEVSADKKWSLAPGQWLEAKQETGEVSTGSDWSFTDQEKVLYQRMKTDEIAKLEERSTTIAFQDQEEALNQEILALQKPADQIPEDKQTPPVKTNPVRTTPRVNSNPVKPQVEEKKDVPLTITQIKEKYKAINEYTLFNGRVIRGGLVRTTATEYVVMTEKGEVTLQKGQVRSAKVIQ